MMGMTAAYYTTHNTDLFLFGLLIIVLVLIVIRKAMIRHQARKRAQARKSYFNIRDGH